MKEYTKLSHAGWDHTHKYERLHVVVTHVVWDYTHTNMKEYT